MNLRLKATKATEEIMQMLEDIGIITRLKPGAHDLNVQYKESRHKSLYESDSRFGPHKLITVTINDDQINHLIYHNDNEDFMILDGHDKEALILTICLLDQRILTEKINNQSLSEKDFIALDIEANNPFISFFTMHKGYAHVETCGRVSDRPPSFYVTESRDLDENIVDFKPYKLSIEVTNEKIRN